MSRRSSTRKDETTELIRKLLIVQLGIANVPQQQIRKIAGCDMSLVTKIIKLLPRKQKKTEVHKKD